VSGIELSVSEDSGVWAREYVYFGSPDRWNYRVGCEEAHIDESGSSFKCVLRRALDAAFVQGHRDVNLRTGDGTGGNPDLSTLGDFFQSRRLYATPRRLRLLAEQQLAVAERKRQQRLRKARVYRRLALHRAFQKGPTPETIQEFYARWKKVSGFRTADPHDWKPYLAMAKEVLIADVVSRAKREGWTLGSSHDSLARGDFGRIVYVETPLGQVSFHVREGTFPALPDYHGAWSGVRNSDVILSRLYSL